MKKHSEYGAEIIQKTMSDIEEEEYCKIAFNIAKYHHERYDGTGYPTGLEREDIPLEARVMALAWERGSSDMICLNPAGIWSVEKKVLHRKDMGMMM